MRQTAACLALLAALPLFGCGQTALAPRAHEVGMTRAAARDAGSSTVTAAQLMGAKLYANNGTYLGVFDYSYDTDSIYCAFGPYGADYSTQSIFCPYGAYGVNYNVLSPWCPYANTPPVFRNGKALVAYLTTNTALSPRVDPNDLRGMEPM